MSVLEVQPVLVVSKEKLRSIATGHTLTDCPCCHGPLTDLAALAQQVTARCKLCNVTWKLCLHNDTYQRRAFDTRSHTIELSAHWYHQCACGSQHNVIVYREVPHNRCLGHANTAENCTLEQEGMSKDDYVPGGRKLVTC